MNCPIVHVVQVIREKGGGKSIKISVESIFPSKIIFALIPVVLLFTIPAWKHSPVGAPGCRSSWQHLHPTSISSWPSKGSCLTSHLEERWPRLTVCHFDITDFILTHCRKTQFQGGFLGSSGFWAAKKYWQVSHSGQRILPISECSWITSQTLSPTTTQIKNLGAIKPATSNSDCSVSRRIGEDRSNTVLRPGLTFQRGKHCKGWSFRGAELGEVFQTRRTSCSVRQPSVAGGTRTTSEQPLTTWMAVTAHVEILPEESQASCLFFLRQPLC